MSYDVGQWLQLRLIPTREPPYTVGHVALKRQKQTQKTKEVLKIAIGTNCQFVPLTNRDVLPPVFCLSLALGSPGIDIATTGVQGGGLRSSLHTAVHNYFWIPLPFLLKDP